MRNGKALSIFCNLHMSYLLNVIFRCQRPLYLPEIQPMQYQILSALTVHELERRVSQAIEEGWKPQGGVSVGEVIAQAMIKE